MDSNHFDRDPVELAAPMIALLAEGVAIALFLMMVAVWCVIGSGRLPL